MKDENMKTNEVRQHSQRTPNNSHMFNIYMHLRSKLTLFILTVRSLIEIC